MFINIKRLIFKILKKTPATMEMVKYWKYSGSVQAKVTKKDGAIIMRMEGEDYDFPGYPRGHLLFGKLSKLKHEVKNQVFNESWAKLDKEEPIASHVRKGLSNAFEILDTMRMEIVPPSRMVPAVREIHRAWTKASPETHELRDLICFILQEDDGYRFRFQWIVSYMPTWLFKFINPVKSFGKSLIWLENAEIIGDMKERIRLLRRVLLAFLEDERARKQFTALFREIQWNKVKMTKADKYFFRGKYFKVDLDKFDY